MLALNGGLRGEVRWCLGARVHSGLAGVRQVPRNGFWVLHHGHGGHPAFAPGAFQRVKNVLHTVQNRSPKDGRLERRVLGAMGAGFDSGLTVL